MMNRRQFLWQSGGGLGGIALASLLGDDGLLGAETPRVAGQKTIALHHPAKAKRVLQLFMSGAASQCDLFDYKPLLIERDGQKWDPGEDVTLFQSSPGRTMASPWSWKQYGECGKHLSEIASPLGEVADDMAFIHNMVATSNVHGPATFMQASGFVRPGFPSAGAWVSYGLGRMTDDLPTFVVLPDPRGFAPNGPKNWASGFLPAEHQGTLMRPGTPRPIHDLFPPDSANFISKQGEVSTQDTLAKLNKLHQQTRQDDSRLEARICAYELAAKMQVAAPQVLDLRGETRQTLEMYGLTPENAMSMTKQEGISRETEIEYFGRNCLVARRLLERGVRFIQIWSGADNGFPRRNWDSHEDIKRDHGPLGWGMSVGAAALIKDLKQRGLLEDTIVLWTTEFGRMPCSQGKKGRDHNPFVFSNWLAGGGVKGGTTFGHSDEWSYKPLERDKPTMCYDVHATILHLLGYDHLQLTVRHDGIDRRLTDVHGHIIDEIVA